jgi:hypothetical protein
MLSEVLFRAACDDVPFVIGFHELVCYPACSDLHLVMEYIGPRITDFLRQQKQGGGGRPLLLLESTVLSCLCEPNPKRENHVVCTRSFHASANQTLKGKITLFAHQMNKSQK